MSKWKEIYQILKKEIEDKVYPPGSEFPTNLDLMKRFNVHTSTIQNAIRRLIEEGLIISEGNRTKRKVRIIPTLSHRKGGFSDEHGEKAKKNVLEIRKISSTDEMPEFCREDVSFPALYYLNEQFIDGIQAGVSCSIIPNIVSIDELEKLLKQENASLYRSLEELGHKPVSCEESFIVDLPSEQDREDLHLPKNSNIPVIRMVRKTFAPQGNLVEICHLLCRADCYEFHYKFDF
ncbi:GntR family transcriptional regulator [Thermoactinomyces mirandus]|uniref:GntR family transcriptional regulator n=1 Tax=Thermoactinomyces mirandus TaxID=2756294 RepID=A0A7W1XS80_9BACL|nr:GntR family transcriptional regulator [Thermoactinomyces mirandus]MBA4602186.1 GntR family transcriptional regulator [Thermoactinomyces mirandus]